MGVRLESPIIEIGLTAVYYSGLVEEFSYSTTSILCACDVTKLEQSDCEALMFHAHSPHGRELLSEVFSYKNTLKPLTEGLSILCEDLDVAGNPDALWYFRGPQFDEAMLRHQLEIDTPWKYYNVRCQRTLTKALPLPPNYEPFIPKHKHRAGADAEAQARDLVARLGYYFAGTKLPADWVL